MDEKLIRKHYGEKMWHFCRDNFSLILETPNKLFTILKNTFYPTHELYEDLKKEGKLFEFKKYIFLLSGFEIDNEYVKTDKSPEELLREAGYTLYECKTEEDIQSFKKYYKSDEQLCTFKGGRLNYCYVFFAVKDNVEDIKRERFFKPERQDEYGTSVISIQFTKDDSNILSIKNRYNHTVDNPDATFSNNLENIIPGLTYSFKKYYGLSQNIASQFSLEKYILGINNILYRTNIEIDNIHYCQDNIILEYSRPVMDYSDKSRYLIIDNYILDLVDKKFIQYSCEIDDFYNVEKNIKKIEITKDGEYRWVTLFHDEGISRIKIKNNCIYEYYNDFIKEIGNSFMEYNETLTKITLQNVEKIGSYFCLHNNNKVDFYLPHVKEIGSCFLADSKGMEKCSLPEVIEIGRRFLTRAEFTKEIILPNVKKIGDGFIKYGMNLKRIYAPNVETIGDDFLFYNYDLENIQMNKLRIIGNCFLFFNNKIEFISFPKVEEIGEDFLKDNYIIKKVFLPKVKTIGPYFLHYNVELKSINLPNVKKIGNYFLPINTKIRKVHMPILETIGQKSLSNNICITDINFPCIYSLGSYFMDNNVIMKNISIPTVKYIGDYVFKNVKHLDTLNIGEVDYLGKNFLEKCENIEEFKLQESYKDVIGKNKVYFKKK